VATAQQRPVDTLRDRHLAPPGEEGLGSTIRVVETDADQGVIATSCQPVGEQMLDLVDHQMLGDQHPVHPLRDRLVPTTPQVRGRERRAGTACKQRGETHRVAGEQRPEPVPQPVLGQFAKEDVLGPEGVARCRGGVLSPGLPKLLVSAPSTTGPAAAALVAHSINCW
jgi:hypothetical protein